MTSACSKDMLQLLITEITLKITSRQTSNTSRTLVGSKIVDHSDVIGTLPAGTAPTTSSFLT